MDATVHIERYGPDVADAYQRLFDESEGKSTALLNWRFAANPHGEAAFATARLDGRIEGMIALVPARLVDGARTAMGYQAIDTIVSPSLRGQGMFVRLGRAAEAFCSDENALLWGFPNANAAPGWFGKLDWTRTGYAPFLVRPLRTGYVFRRVAPFLARFDRPLARRPKGLSAPTHPPLGAAYDALWLAARRERGLTVDRDSTWMNWRLARPDADYRCAVVGDSPWDAMIITRRAHKHDAGIVYVMEAMARPGSESELRQLLHDQLASDAHAGSEVALAWAREGSTARNALNAAGFWNFPPRLRPIEIHIGYWVDDASSFFLRGADPWSVTYLDSDTV